MRVVCILLEKPQSPHQLQSIAEVFFRLTPDIMLRGDRAIFFDISKCRPLYSENKFIKILQFTLKRLNLKARITVADDSCTALALAHFYVGDKSLLPLEALKIYNEDSNQMISSLKSLGLNFFRDLTKLNPKEISSRFGQKGLLTYLKVRSEIPEVWNKFIPLEIVEENYEFDLETPADNLEPVYFVLKGLLDRCELRLRGRGFRIKQFSVILRQEFGGKSDYEIKILLQLPYLSSKVIFQITKEKIDAQVRNQPLNSRIAEILIRVEEEAPYFMTQKNIFDQKKEEVEESFFQLISRLATRLGKDRVFFAKMKESFLPEKNWLRSEKEFKENLTYCDPQNEAGTCERPLRLFAPEEFHLESNETIKATSQQEMILSDWWEGFTERKYMRLLTSKGRDLWVFKSGKNYFLHGVFD